MEQVGQDNYQIPVQIQTKVLGSPSCAHMVPKYGLWGLWQAIEGRL